MSTPYIYQSPVLKSNEGVNALRFCDYKLWLCKEKTEEITGIKIARDRGYRVLVSSKQFTGSKRYKFRVWRDEVLGNLITLVAKGKNVEFFIAFEEFLEEIAIKFFNDTATTEKHYFYLWVELAEALID